MEISHILEALCQAGGVSGSENEVMGVFERLGAPYFGKMTRDALGNICFERKNKKNTKTLMLEAHADKIGLVVKHITHDGFVLFSQVGGADKKILPASRVIVRGREPLRGVISSLPPHLKEKQTFDLEDLCIDLGYGKKQLEGMVQVGDMVEFDADYTLLSGDKVAASAFDDRAGLAIILRCLELLGDEGCNIALLSSVQEEVGCRGAAAAAYALKPDMYICVDACHGKTPDASDNVFPLGGGAVITVGPNVQPYMSERLIQTAREKNIPYQIDVDSGNTGTNAWSVQVARQGIPTALVSLPVRYMHTYYEVMSLKDAENAAKLLAEFALIQNWEV